MENWFRTNVRQEDQEPEHSLSTNPCTPTHPFNTEDTVFLWLLSSMFFVIPKFPNSAYLCNSPHQTMDKKDTPNCSANSVVCGGSARRPWLFSKTASASWWMQPLGCNPDILRVMFGEHRAQGLGGYRFLTDCHMATLGH